MAEANSMDWVFFCVDIYSPVKQNLAIGCLIRFGEYFFNNFTENNITEKVRLEQSFIRR